MFLAAHFSLPHTYINNTPSVICQQLGLQYASVQYCNVPLLSTAAHMADAGCS